MEPGTEQTQDRSTGPGGEAVNMSARTPEAEPLLTPAEVATMFRVDPKTVTRWAKAGKLTSIRTLGGHRRYRETEVRALLAGIPQQRSEWRLAADLAGEGHACSRTITGEQSPPAQRTSKEGSAPAATAPPATAASATRPLKS